MWPFKRRHLILIGHLYSDGVIVLLIITLMRAKVSFIAPLVFNHANS